MSPVTVGNWLLILAAVPATIAPLFYMRVPWYRSRLGRHLMCYMIAIAIVLDLGVIRLHLGAHAWFDWTRLVAFALVVAALWWRLLIVASAQPPWRPDLLKRADDERSEAHAQD